VASTGPVVVVGHSFGCLIARVLAVLRPERVAGLVLVDGSVPAMVLWPDDDGPRQDGDGPGATVIDTIAGARELAVPTRRIPAVVLTRTPGRWDNHPLASVDVDREWSRAQRSVAAELDATHVLATDAGHRLNVEAPRLVALAIDAVVRAWVTGQPLALDPADVRAVGGRFAMPA
jgi:pimeloyl-ACP methyl ester carboxylesterase